MQPEHGDPRPSEDEPGVRTFEVDPGIYLPEGVELADDSDDSDDSDDTDGIDHTDDTVDAKVDDSVDTTLLERIEGELDEVDAALQAIDAGRPESSALLHRLLDASDENGDDEDAVTADGIPIGGSTADDPVDHG